MNYYREKALYLIATLFVILTIQTNEAFTQQWTIYTPPQGLTGTSVNDMITDNQGYIWFATDDGVSRFNGGWESFRAEDGLINNYVNTMAKDSDGILWIGTYGGISKIDPASDLKNRNNWHNYTVSETDSGLSNNIITSILFDRDGKIWFGTHGGGISVVEPSPDITHPSRDPLLDSENWSTYTTANGIGNNKIRDMEMDSMGNIWIANADSINVFEFSQSKWRTFKVLPDDDRGAEVIYKDQKGNMWIGGTDPFGLYKAYPNNLSQFDEHFTISDGLASNSITKIIQDKESMMWFGHGSNGISSLSSELNTKVWKYFREIDGLASDAVESIMEDSEENIWFGHLEERGVSRLDKTWLSYLTQGGAELNFINGFFPDNQENLWIATDGGAVRIQSTTNLLFAYGIGDTITKANSGLSAKKVAAVFKDSESFLWFATNNGAMRVSFENIHNPAEWTKFDASKGLSEENVRGIIEDKLGYLWFATSKMGVNRVHVTSVDTMDKWTRITRANGLASDSVVTIFSDRNVNLWFATLNGVSFFDPALDPTVPGNWANYDANDGLVHNEVNAIYQDFEGNIWFATEGGVSRIDPWTDLRNPANWTNYSIENGLKSNFVTSISQLKPGEIWFGTAVGATKFEVDNSINPWTTYTVSDGLKSNFVRAIYADRANGNIWFGTRGGGVTRYRPKKLPPETFLENKRDVVTERTITFNFRGADINTSEEDLRFLYRIDDEAWIETSDNFAVVSIDESNKPEQHVFQVKALDQDGNVDESPASDAFYVIDPEYGSNVEITDVAIPGVRLFIPPGVLGEENSLTIKSLEKYELPDTSDVILAYQIEGKPEEFVSLNKPATLGISLLNSANYNRNELAIYRFKEGETWDAIGGTVKSRFDTLTITTSITDLGIYAVRNQATSKLEKPSNEITIQPRIFSPTGNGQGHGDRANISFFLKDNSDVTIKVYNIAGRLKKLVTENEPMLPGMNAIVWDGQDDDGNYCVSGLYIVTVETDWDIKREKVMVLNKYQ